MKLARVGERGHLPGTAAFDDDPAAGIQAMEFEQAEKDVMTAAAPAMHAEISLVKSYDMRRPLVQVAACDAPAPAAVSSESASQMPCAAAMLVA